MNPISPGRVPASASTQRLQSLPVGQRAEQRGSFSQYSDAFVKNDKTPSWLAKNANWTTPVLLRDYGKISFTPTLVRHTWMHGRLKSISITTRPIEMRALTNEQLAAAVKRKDADDKLAYKKSTAELKQEAMKTGYFGSDPHVAWAKAAEARTGGRIPASFWKEFDPFGGTAGNGPHVLPEGAYPGFASKIAMAHDTDWSLGRYFKVGPLRGLHSQTPRLPADMKDLGMVGLAPKEGFSVDLYTNGHPHWRVKY